MDKLNAAVIGVGNMGQHHARIYNDMNDVNLIAICDLNENIGKALALKFHCKYYRNYQDLINQEKIDLATIAVPTHLHYKVASDFINAGINLLVEKPICNNLNDAQKLIDEIKNKNIILMVGHIERFNPAIQKLMELLDKEVIGEIICANVRRIGVSPPPFKNSNIIYDLCVHDIDIFNLIFNKIPSKIISTGRKLVKDNEIDYAEIILKYGKSNGVIHTNWVTPTKIRTLTITGKKGYIELDYIKQSIDLFLPYKYIKGIDPIIGSAKKIEIDVDKKEPLFLELNHFVNCIKSKTKPDVDAEIAYNVLKIAKDSFDICKEELE